MADKIFHPEQWGGDSLKWGHITHPFGSIHSISNSIWPLWKKGVHVLLHSPIAAARAVMGDSSPISWASSHFLSVLKVLWKRLAWGIYSRAKETQREGGHVKHTFMTPETDWTHSTSPSLKEKTEEINKRDWNINRAALGGLGEGWRDRRSRGGFATSPTHSSVLNRTRQCLCNWIIAPNRGQEKKKKKRKRVGQVLGLRRYLLHNTGQVMSAGMRQV